MIPRGFQEIQAIAHPPVIAREFLSRGAVAKYLGSKPMEFVGQYGAIDYMLVHEFQARAGYGLPFRLTGTPDLNAKMWAVRPGWTLWMQYLGVDAAGYIIRDQNTPSHVEHIWHIGAVVDIPVLRQMMSTMEADHRVLDQAIAVEAGMVRASHLGYVGVVHDDQPIALLPADGEVATTQSDDRPELVPVQQPRKPFSRKSLTAVTRDLSDEELDLPPVDRAARPIHALLRTLLKDGAKPREFVDEKMRQAGFSPRQILRARAAVGVVAKRRGVKGRRGGGVWLLALPSAGKTRIVTRTAEVVKLGRVRRALADATAMQIASGAGRI